MKLIITISDTGLNHLFALHTCNSRIYGSTIQLLTSIIQLIEVGCVGEGARNRHRCAAY